jgi:uncharacterized protein (DUF433 family)
MFFSIQRQCLVVWSFQVFLEATLRRTRTASSAARFRRPVGFHVRHCQNTHARYNGISSTIWSPTMNKQLISVDPEIHSGTPVFAGTRVPIKTLFDHLEAGDSLEVFLDDFPSVSRDLAVAVLEEAHSALLPDAHPA